MQWKEIFIFTECEVVAFFARESVRNLIAEVKSLNQLQHLETYNGWSIDSIEYDYGSIIYRMAIYLFLVQDIFSLHFLVFYWISRVNFDLFQCV